jgi:hypothetical protein
MQNRCPKYPRIRLVIKLLEKCLACERFQGSALVEGYYVLIHCGAGPRYAFSPYPQGGSKKLIRKEASLNTTL